MPVKNLGGIGLAVNDMSRSVAFYRDILGYVPISTFDVPDFTETILALPQIPYETTGAVKPEHSTAGRSKLILMQYKHKPPPRDQIGKLVWYVEDEEIVEIARKCKEYGCKTYKKLGKGEEKFRGIHMVYDLDGFLIEFVPLRLQGGAIGDKAKI